MRSNFQGSCIAIGIFWACFRRTDKESVYLSAFSARQLVSRRVAKGLHKSAAKMVKVLVDIPTVRYRDIDGFRIPPVFLTCPF